MEEEAQKQKQQRNSMIMAITFLIMFFSLFATIYPAFEGKTPRIEYAFFGFIAAFMIILIFSRGAVTQRKELLQGILMQRKKLQHTTSDKRTYRKCPICGRAITFEVNVCPYCERRIR
jgi:predicted nucleic acid-binding Zn ribbon protein